MGKLIFSYGRLKEPSAKMPLDFSDTTSYDPFAKIMRSRIEKSFF